MQRVAEVPIEGFGRRVSNQHLVVVTCESSRQVDDSGTFLGLSGKQTGQQAVRDKYLGVHVDVQLLEKLLLGLLVKHFTVGRADVVYDDAYFSFDLVA